MDSQNEAHKNVSQKETHINNSQNETEIRLTKMIHKMRPAKMYHNTKRDPQKKLQNVTHKNFTQIEIHRN